MNNQDFETTIHSKRDSVFLDYYTGDLDTNRMYIWGVPVDRENWLEAMIEGMEIETSGKRYQATMKAEPLDISDCPF